MMEAETVPKINTVPNTRTQQVTRYNDCRQDLWDDMPCETLSSSGTRAPGGTKGISAPEKEHERNSYMLTPSESDQIDESAELFRLSAGDSHAAVQQQT